MMGTKFGAVEVLQRAYEILSAGPLPPDSCGPYCPWCAAAQAKSELDEEYGTGLGMVEVFIYYNTEVESDRPLIEARTALKPWATVDIANLSQDAALAILKDALKSLEGSDE